eukprot:1563475-Alexandrium_andersonii.AAC.1
MLTKAVAGEPIDRHLASSGIQWESGRAASAPGLDGLSWAAVAEGRPSVQPAGGDPPAGDS